MVDKQAVHHRILELIHEDGSEVAQRLASEFNFSRQTANNHIKALLRQDLIKAEGNTRARTYRLVNTHEEFRVYPCEGLEEDRVWREMVAPIVSDLAENLRDIWHYGITEMVNNAIDHSGAYQVFVKVIRNALYTDCWVMDEGEGIFVKIKRELGLYDQRESLLELAKGKLTTDPANHTGEGIFFTSRVFDEFRITSGTLNLIVNRRKDDWLIESSEFQSGTLVILRLLNDSKRLIKDVFDEFAMPEEYSFAKTIVPVRLAQYEGEKLISRSQAKRLYQRFERFRHVVLDFKDVAEIGQAFADELFRVFPAAHPDVELVPVKTTEAVSQMIKRVTAPQT